MTKKKNNNNNNKSNHLLSHQDLEDHWFLRYLIKPWKSAA